MYYESKQLGKKLLGGYYGRILLCVFLVMLLAGQSAYGANLFFNLSSATSISGYNNSFDMRLMALYFPSTIYALFTTVFTLIPFIILAVVIVRALMQPLRNGLCCMLIDLHHGHDSDIRTVFQDAFSIGYWRYVGGYVWESLFVYLWSLLLIIPGIIKHYAYAMNRYLLTEYKSIRIREALDISKRMTRGYKMELFFFDLSFIGWWLLNILTAGLLGILYVRPYYESAKTALYLKIKENALQHKRISYFDLKVPEPREEKKNYQSIALSNEAGSLK